MDDHSITIEENSEPCISKVHVGLRNVKPKAYKPVVVSIGPYHKANPDLQAMQQNKEWYLNSLLKRRNESREIYPAKLAKFDRKAWKCYVDPVNCNIDEFAEMMLLDGCFIVEFLRKMDWDVMVEFDNDDPIPKLDWMVNKILYDMILLENQLPYFILSEFYEMTKYEGEKPLVEIAMSCFNFMLPRPRLNSNNAFGNIGEINHLLHLIHVFCRPFPKKTINESSDDQTCCLLLPQNNESGSDKSYEMKNQMGTVVELQEAMVKFKKVGKIYNGALKNKTEEEEDDYVSLFDIDFKYGVMIVPCFQVNDETETMLRNLIAYEQHFRNVLPQYFTDFACLMNQLIDTKNDIKALRLKGIIVNFLQNGNDELPLLFNRLTDGVFESYKPYYHEVYQEVEKHCRKTSNILMAKLKGDYSTNPWAGLSTVAAALLLFLTVVQTVVALITLLV